MVDAFAKTPRYVLKEGSHPIGPAVLQTPLDDVTTVFFGFSGKPAYDLFIANCDLALTPYPLVNGFLKSQVAENFALLRLIILDATSPGQTAFQAATMQTVLDAALSNSQQVVVSHDLHIDETSQAYRCQIRSDVAYETPVQ